jgi:hypothetical protein
MAIKWMTQGNCGHSYHISWPHCPYCYEAEDTVCDCCGKKMRRYVLTEEGKRVREQQATDAARGE